ncbi:peptidoglycan editing factor PgeF [Candidatus Microgenomates bacterium]|nr:peptidoglycan editing factor PgeF [Candidatus Microgenomates bacterium]
MVKYGFSKKIDGDMRDNMRMMKFLNGARPGIKAVVRPRQIHGDHIEFIDATAHTNDILQSFGETDGVITRAKNTALAIITADCVPAVYSDETTNMIGASHQGWKGALARLPQKMIQHFEKLGSSPKNIRVSIGPAINACCYEIHQDRAIMFRNEFPNTKAINNQGNHFFLNLTRLTYEQLRDAGVPDGNIEHTINCTSCQNDTYFSYRRAFDKSNFDEQLSYIVQS